VKPRRDPRHWQVQLEKCVDRKGVRMSSFKTLRQYFKVRSWGCKRFGKWESRDLVGCAPDVFVALPKSKRLFRESLCRECLKL